MQISTPLRTVPKPVAKTGWPFKVVPAATPAEIEMRARIARVLAVTRRQWWPAE
jgi:hypothetical protein